MNPFQLDYISRIREWKNIRETAKTLPIDSACILIDRWWQQVPLVKHHLHWADQESWPDPWTLLSENNYCTLTRAVGICYTLLLSNVTDINLVIARDCQAEDHNLVIVNCPKYILNFWPDSVISTNLTDFKIIKNLSLDTIKNKIRNKE